MCRFITRQRSYGSEEITGVSFFLFSLGSFPEFAKDSQLIQYLREFRLDMDPLLNCLSCGAMKVSKSGGRFLPRSRSYQRLESMTSAVEPGNEEKNAYPPSLPSAEIILAVMSLNGANGFPGGCLRD